MKLTFTALTLAALSIFWGPTPSALAESKVARGTVAVIGGESLTVSVSGRDMKFAIDSKTSVQAKGGSTKAAKAAADGRPGIHLKEVLTMGQPVAITYNDEAGVLHATAIRSIPKAPGVAASADAALRSNGTVKAMGGDWITINGSSGGGASFEQTFKIDPTTKVFAKGAGKASAANGGKMSLKDAVANGDHVSISYHKVGDALHASDVHVTVKAAH